MRVESVHPALCALALVGVALLPACDAPRNLPPRIEPVADQVFRVDQGDTVQIEVSDPEGDAVELQFVLDPLPPSRAQGLPGAPHLARLGGGALLSWTPSADDAGPGEAVYRAEIRAVDEHGAAASVDFDITVTAGPGPMDPLRFVSPPGAGVLLNGDCLEALPVVVEGLGDEVSIEVDAAAGRCGDAPDCEPLVLAPPGPGAQKTLDWCPTAAQHRETVQHELRLDARALAGDAVVGKGFFVHFHRDAEPGCGGAPPVIEHAPPDGPLEGPLDYVITAEITDDLGIKVDPVLAFAVDVADPPPDPAAIDGWQAVEFARPDSEGRPDRWQAAIPNLGLAPGVEATISYAIFAVDDDDEASAACDRSAEAGIFTLRVVGGEDPGPAYPPCTACLADAQCGGADDRCAVLFDGAFCARGCAEEGDCGEGEICSRTPTVEGDEVFLCRPADENCGQLCAPDAFEMPGNDDADAAVAIEAGPQADLTLCDEDEDWFTVAIEAGDAVVVQAMFDGRAGDLDLGLQLPGEAGLGHQSLGGGGDLEVVREPCAPQGGRATVAVWAYAGRVGPYDLDVQVGPGDCDAPCVADRYESVGEGNDQRETAAEVELPFVSGRLTICPGDRDFFAVRPAVGQLLRADLQLAEQRLAGDLGLRLWHDGVVIDESAAFRPAEAVQGVAGFDEGYAIEVFGQTPRSVNTYTLRVEALDGMPCDANQPCAVGQICSEGICVEDRCRADADCGPDQICVTPRLGQPAEVDGGHCAARCEPERGCRQAGEVCKPLGGKSVCLLEGAQSIGQRCARHQECGGEAVCLDLPGGYCGRVGCDGCPDGSVCARHDDRDVCLRACDGPAQCRVAEQYVCREPERGRSAVCLPADPVD